MDTSADMVDISGTGNASDIGSINNNLTIKMLMQRLISVLIIL